jgi:effector-binding domain-containing protein
MEVKLKKMEPMQVAFVSHVGPYSEAGKLYGEIAKWLGQKQLKITGPRLDSSMIIQKRHQHTN